MRTGAVRRKMRLSEMMVGRRQGKLEEEGFREV